MAISDIWEMFSLYSVENREVAFGGEANYSKFYGAMDAFHDSNLALFEVANAEYKKIPVITCIGFLQVIVTQQNVLITVSDILGDKFDCNLDPTFKRHRILRDRICGHPIMQGGEVSTFFPSDERGSDWFMVAFYGDTKKSEEYISIPNFLKEHQLAIGRALPKILKAAESLESKMFLEHPYETMINGKVVCREGKTWSQFKHYCDQRIKVVPTLNV